MRTRGGKEGEEGNSRMRGGEGENWNWSFLRIDKSELIIISNLIEMSANINSHPPDERKCGCDLYMQKFQ